LANQFTLLPSSTHQGGRKPAPGIITGFNNTENRIFSWIENLPVSTESETTSTDESDDDAGGEIGGGGGIGRVEESGPFVIHVEIGDAHVLLAFCRSNFMRSSNTTVHDKVTNALPNGRYCQHF
jgi:hypothetical protein